MRLNDNDEKVIFCIVIIFLNIYNIKLKNANLKIKKYIKNIDMVGNVTYNVNRNKMTIFIRFQFSEKYQLNWKKVEMSLEGSKIDEM